MFPLAIVLSVLVGVVLGLLGGGGSILTTPILLYVLDLPIQSASATSLVVVGVTAITAMAPHARAGNVAWRAGTTFGGAGMVGAYLGGRIAGQLPDRVVLLLFAAMMLGTSLAMFRGRSETAASDAEASTPKLIVSGLLVGVVPGLVGAGGGFLIVPALTLFAGLPMRRAIGTSLLVIALNSVAGFAGHASHVRIDPGIAGPIAAAAVVGSVLGGRFAQRIAPELLRKGFAGFVLAMAVFVISQQI